MEFTGERYVPGVGGPMRLEHLQRYALCRSIVHGRRVLDLACGEGYGSALLAAVARQVVGIDVDAGTIRHARGRYGHLDNARFLVGACEALPLGNRTVDVVVSFETIEHHDRQVEMIQEIRRVLSPGGVLILSSPNKPVYDAIAAEPNPFHVRELHRSELEALLRSAFPHVVLWGQRPAVASFTYPLQPAPPGSPPALRTLTIEGDEVRDAVAVLGSPVYLLAACSDAPLSASALDLSSISIEPGDDPYERLNTGIRHFQERHREAEARADLLQAALGARWRRWAAPMRRIDRALRRGRSAVVPRAEQLLRRSYSRLPVSSGLRWRLKSACFPLLGWLLRDTESYRRWHGTAWRPRMAFAVPPRPTPADPTSWAPIALPDPGRPVVSIVVPVHGRIDLTWRCLASIASHPPARPTEVLVVDDASPDDTAARLAPLEHLRLIRLPENQGFIGTCNRGAREARGEYLVFLNNDTVVGPGWCDELIRTFEDMPAAGLVGAKLLYPDGRLQEAGGIIWRDGAGCNYGRGDDPLKPAYCYRREVDYLSGAALAVPRALFAELGGFDPRYAPAYCEDSDLAFRVREAGRAVVYQPLAQVVHEEGGTAGRDLARGVKAYQVQNARKLAERWRHVLTAGHLASDVDVERAKERAVTRRALVIDHRTPTPDQDSGSITALNLMRLLQQLGFKVTFIPAANFLFLDRYTPDAQRQGIECLYAPYVRSVEQHLGECGELYDLVVLFRYTIARQHLGVVRRLCPRAKVVLHTSDLHFIREEREAELRGDPTLRRRAAGTRRDELAVIGAVDATIVHSTYEEAVLARECPGAMVVVFGWAIEAPGTTVPFGPRRDLAFVGGYEHPPNVDAALYFAREVFPLVAARVPGVRLYVVGSRAPAEVLALQSDDVIVTGYVQDLGAILDRLRLTVAPVRYGAGIKNKISTSLSHGVPCVATTVGAEGMGLVDGREVLIADAPEAFAEAVARVYTDGALWNRLSAEGLQFVRRHYSFGNGAAILRRLLGGLGLETVAAPVVGAPANPSS